MRSRFALALPLALSACLVPNPHLTEDGELGLESGTEMGSEEESSSSDGESESSGVTESESETEAGDTCDNGEQDGDETDVDCGGSCSPCDAGQGCEVPEDCESMVCEDGICSSPTCSDGVANGDEVGTDCGGPCVFCSHSEFVESMDDSGDVASLGPSVAVFSDGAFSVTYLALEAGEHRVRWFDDAAQPLAASQVVGPQIEASVLDSSVVVSHPGDPSREAHVGFTGLGLGDTNDAYLASAEPGGGQVVSTISEAVGGINLVRCDASYGIVGCVWREDGTILFRRFDPTLGGGTWLGPSINVADSTGTQPSVAGSEAGFVLAWDECPFQECTIFLRRFDDQWIDDAPVDYVPDGVDSVSSLRAGISNDGRVGLVWIHVNEDRVWAAILSPDLQPEGPVWELPTGDPKPPNPNAGVRALSDGSFVFAWPAADQVRVRRFVAPDVPVVGGVETESTWPAIPSRWAAVAANETHVVVVWDVFSGDSSLIQGQVLSY